MLNHWTYLPRLTVLITVKEMHALIMALHSDITSLKGKNKTLNLFFPRATK